MDELKDWVVRYPGTAKPGEIWNSFIFWHSSNFPWVTWDYNQVFALIDKITYWDEIIVYYWQKKYKYIVREKKVISPNNVSLLKNRGKGKSELTIMSCWPIWTALNRMIIIGELVKE
jgi:LPXTG-site transpeptidase (sortase) family protein